MSYISNIAERFMLAVCFVNKKLPNQRALVSVDRPTAYFSRHNAMHEWIIGLLKEIVD